MTRKEILEKEKTLRSQKNFIEEKTLRNIIIW